MDDWTLSSTKVFQNDIKCKISIRYNLIITKLIITKNNKQSNYYKRKRMNMKVNAVLNLQLI